jgi:tetratricopeptide (TPR) repeat protein
MRPKRIFVSATNRDLASYRELASQSLRKRGYEVDDQAVFHLTYLEIFEKLKQRIEQCDAVVCLIGFVYGSEPSDRQPDQPRRSYTHWEYLLARDLNKPVYLLLAGETTPFDAGVDERESDELRQLQAQYRGEVIRGRDWAAFASKSDLGAELAELRFPWEPPRPDHKPCNLPLASIGRLFKGREAFLGDLQQRLGVPSAPATAIVNRMAVHGLGGVGKTRAAVEYAWRHGEDYTALLFVSAPTVAELRANLANLVGVLGTTAAGTSVDQQLAEVLRWLDVHPGWLLIIDNVDTEEAAQAVEDLLNQLRAGHVLITSRIGNWSAAVEPLDLDVLAATDAAAFLLERTPHRRQQPDDEAVAAAIARELDGLALALEQAGANVDRLRLSFGEYLERWKAKRPEVLKWHDLRLMKYPASVAVTWETTFTQLTEPERRLLEVLAWLAPEPIPLLLLDAALLAAAIPERREALAGLAGYSLARFDATGEAVLVHRLVQETARRRQAGTEPKAGLRAALDAVDAIAPLEPPDVRTWPVWTPLAPHAAAVARHADAASVYEPTARLMNQLGLCLAKRCQFPEAERLYRRALSIDEQSLGPDHPSVATDLNYLAALLQATNRLGQAEPLYRRALDIDELSYGPGHPNVAIRLNNLAVLLRDTHRPDEAEPLSHRAIDIFLQFTRSTGHEHPHLGAAIGNYSSLLEAMGRTPEQIEQRVQELLTCPVRPEGS